MTAIFTKLPVNSYFMGVVNVPMCEAIFNPLPSQVIGGWGFQRSSLWPTISAYGNLGVVTPNMVTALDVITLTPFVFNTTKFPLATATVSTYLQGGRPMFFAAKVFGTYNRIAGQADYFQALSVLGVNTFSATLAPAPFFYQSAHAGYQLASGSENLFISNFLFPSFGRLIVRTTGNVHGFVGLNYNAPASSFVPDLFRVVDIILLPMLSKADLANDFTYVLLEPDATHNVPTQVAFTANTGVTGAGGYFYPNFDVPSIADAFDLNINWSNATSAPMQATNSGFLMWSAGTTPLTPTMPGTLILMTQEFQKYWVINLVPMTNKAADMIYNAPTGVASWRVTRDINGIWYFGSSFDNTFVLTSCLNLNLSLDWPQALMPVFGLPCFGSCVPAPLNIPAI